MEGHTMRFRTDTTSTKEAILLARRWWRKTRFARLENPITSFGTMRWPDGREVEGESLASAKRIAWREAQRHRTPLQFHQRVFAAGKAFGAALVLCLSLLALLPW